MELLVLEQTPIGIWLLVGFKMCPRYMVKTNTELREKRKQWFCDMEQKLQESWSSKEDSLFYYHSSEVLIPAL